MNVVIFFFFLHSKPRGKPTKIEQRTQANSDAKCSVL